MGKEGGGGGGGGNEEEQDGMSVHSPCKARPSSSSSLSKEQSQVELELRLLEALEIYPPSKLKGIHRHFVLFGLMELLRKSFGRQFSSEEVLQLLGRFYNLEMVLVNNWAESLLGAIVLLCETSCDIHEHSLKYDEQSGSLMTRTMKF